MPRFIAGLGLALVVTLAPASALAVAWSWADGSGNWNTPVNWNPASVPSAGSVVNIVFTDGVARTVTYDYTGAAVSLGGLTLNLSGLGLNTVTLAMPANNLTTGGGIVVGSSGRATFNQSSGTTTISGGSGLLVGSAAGSSGTYVLSSTSALAVTGDEVVGSSGTGSLNQAGTSTNTISSHLFVGNASTANGTYTQSGGSLSSNSEGIGFSGTGTFTHSGGTNSITTNLDVGAASGSTGAYNLSGTGALSGMNEYVGDAGSGNFTQNGGMNTVGNTFYVGFSASGIGTYTLNSGSLSSNADEKIGYNATGSGGTSGGTFNQNGGTNTTGISSELDLGYNTGSTGTYNLNGGTLSSNTVIVGFNGSGIFNQTGGMHIISGGLFFGFGFSSPSPGAYTLSGGTLTVSQGISVGGSGTGVLTVSGTGVLTSNSQLDVSHGSVINLSGGTINTTDLMVNGEPSLFHWTSGKLNLTNNLTFDSAAAGFTTAAAFGPALILGTSQTLMITGNEGLGGTGAFSLTLNSGSTHVVTGALTVNPTGTITQNAGSALSYASFTQAGGTVNGTLQNQTTFNYQSGLFNGRLLNQGTVNLGPSFTAGNGIEDDTSITISTGQIVTLNGAGLDNQGTFTMAGGTLNGTGPLANNALLTGYGTLGGSGGFTNNAQLSIGGVNGILTLSNSGPNSNLGNIDVASVTQLKLTGGNLANSGTVYLNGGTVAGTATLNNTTGIITGHGTISSPLANTGLLVVDGGILNITQPLANGGEILLNGGAADLSGGGLITNSGLIRGDGRIFNAANNAAGGEIRAESGKRVKLLASGAANAGRINLLGGTVEFTQPYTNGPAGQILGTGTVIVGGTGMTNQGQLIFSSGVGYIYGDVNNNTSNATKGITVSGNSNVTFWDDVTHTSGSLLKVQTGSSATFFGTFGGGGSITGGGDVYFEADLTPGSSPASVSYTANIHFDSTSQLKIELGGTAPGAQFDQVHVAGNLSLGGALQVSLINAFLPVPGNSFDILDWGTLSGAFDTINLPTMNGRIVWDSSQLTTTGTLSVLNTYYAGDINRDGKVTVADISALMAALADLSGYRSMHTDLKNDQQLFMDVVDVNGDGKVNNLDIQSLISIVANNAVAGALPGGVVGGGEVTAVPEPATNVLIGIGAMAIVFCRRLRQTPVE